MEVLVRRTFIMKCPACRSVLKVKTDDIQRTSSLKGIYKRDIEDNTDFKFRNKQIYPIKSDGKVDMERLFTHLTCEEVQEVDDNGKLLPPKRVFEKDRSQRLHWIWHHIKESSPENIQVFMVTERDAKKRQDVTKTYIYDKQQQYVIVLEHQRKDAYYLLTAYYLNKPHGRKIIEKKMKKANKI